MAKKGESKGEKRLKAAKTRRLLRKELQWTVKAEPGPHSRETCIPLCSALRDILAVAKNRAEATTILKQGMVKVDGIARKSDRFPVGLFDVVSLAGKKHYRVLFDKKGRIVLNEIEKKEAGQKLCRVVAKIAVKKGLQQLRCSDGNNFIDKRFEAKVDDSVKVSLPGKGIIESYELREGNIAYITGGQHIGSIAKIKDVLPGTIRRSKLVQLETDKEKFQTIAKHVFVIGSKKPEIDIRV